MTLTAIKYRAYPTFEQAEFFQRTFGCVRKIWNCLLADSIEYYTFSKKHVINQVSQYKAVYPYLKDIDSLALANARIQLQTAYKRFLRIQAAFLSSSRNINQSIRIQQIIKVIQYHC